MNRRQSPSPIASDKESSNEPKRKTSKSLGCRCHRRRSTAAGHGVLRRRESSTAAASRRQHRQKAKLEGEADPLLLVGCADCRRCICTLLVDTSQSRRRQSPGGLAATIAASEVK